MKKAIIAGFVLVTGFVGTVISSQDENSFAVKRERGSTFQDCCLDSSEDSEIDDGA